MLEWEWYDDPNTKAVFIHLLLTANWKETRYHGQVIHAGEAVYGRKALAEQLGLTEGKVKVALEHLQRTGEIIVRTTNKFSVASLVNWELYQSPLEETDNKLPSNDHQTTTPKKRNKEINIKIPPTREDVAKYIAENGFSIDIDYFFDYYDSKGWKVGSTKMKDWKATIRNWARRNNKTVSEPKKLIEF
jgi:hypothetical protein